jgi:nickel/cobalt transporter (NicO) family protein
MKRLALCLLCVCAGRLPVAAHVLDQYLQVAQIAIAPGGAHIELRLIPGVQVAERICALIDADGDGQITTAEGQAYARRALHDVALEVDGRRAPLALAGVQFPSRREMEEGIGAIRLELAAEAALDATGEHQLYFRNDHLTELGVYLVNALVPTTSDIKISGQARDPLQREMRLSFHVAPADTPGLRPWIGMLMLCLCLALFFSRWKHLRQYSRRRFHRLLKRTYPVKFSCRR